MINAAWNSDDKLLENIISTVYTMKMTKPHCIVNANFTSGINRVDFVIRLE